MTGSVIASGIAVYPGAFLFAGGLAKARELGTPGAGKGTVVAWALPLPPRLAWGTLGAAELLAGALVLSGAFAPVPEIAAAALLCAAAALAAWAMRSAPTAACGCFGTTSEPVEARTPLRAGALGVLAAIGALGGAGWTRALSDPAAIAGLVAVGAALVAVTPELGLGARARTTRERARAIACAARRVAPETSIAKLRTSVLWADAFPHLAGEAPLEQWRDGCWRYVVYPARYDGQAASAVFALHLGDDGRGDAVAFVDERDQRVLARMTARRK